MKGITGFGLLVALLVLFNTSMAETESHYHRVSFQVQVQESVANNRMAIVLAAEADEAVPAEVANQVNTTMQWALGKAKAVEGVDVKTGNYAINPIYQKDRLQRWRGYQELHLEGGDFSRLSDLMASLQTSLQVKSTRFFVATETRKAIEQGLIDQAAKRFQQRANQLVKSFMAKRYVLVSVDVNTSGYTPRSDMMMRAAMMAEAASPAFEGGGSDLVVIMHGVIELVP